MFSSDEAEKLYKAATTLPSERSLATRWSTYNSTTALRDYFAEHSREIIAGMRELEAWRATFDPKTGRCIGDASDCRDIDPAELEQQKYTVGDIKIELIPTTELYIICCGEFRWSAKGWLPGVFDAYSEHDAEAIADKLRATNNVPSKE